MKKLKIVIFSLLLLCLTACGRGYTIITSTEAQPLIEEGAFIIDVRTSKEYSESYIENAINVPLDNISELPNLIEDKESVIILYCQTGVRSKEAAKELVSLGYTNVYTLDGGLINWGYGLVESDE